MSDQERYRSRVKIRLIIATVGMLGFFIILSFLLWYEIPAANKDALQILLGFLGGIITAIVSYYFGDSEGHKGED